MVYRVHPKGLLRVYSAVKQSPIVEEDQMGKLEHKMETGAVRGSCSNAK